MHICCADWLSLPAAVLRRQMPMQTLQVSRPEEDAVILLIDSVMQRVQEVPKTGPVEVIFLC